MTEGRDIVFYDGTCGVCHWAIGFLIVRDDVHVFDYAPLQGATFARLVPADQRATLPDSVLLRSPDGTLLSRSRAAAAMLARLPGAWPMLGRLLRLVPPSIADRAYDAIARRRRSLAKAPGGACPLVAPVLRERFLP